MRPHPGVDIGAAQDFSVPEVWGIVNVTPDSFAGGTTDPVDALRLAGAMVEAGASVIDVGGQSTRPRGPHYGQGFARISPKEEWARVGPVIIGLRQLGVPISLDTFCPEVAQRGLDHGVTIINDVSCAQSDKLLALVARYRAQYVLMHNRSDGRVTATNADYHDVVSEVRQELGAALKRVISAGIGLEQVWIDPGIGFAKTASQSMVLLANLEKVAETGLRVLLGASRKSWISALALGSGKPVPGVEDVSRRLAASLAAALWATSRGACALRVHDVFETVQALAAWRCMKNAQR